MIKEKIETLVAEWAIPAAIGVAVLGSCAARSYFEGDKPAESQTEHKKPTPGREDVITSLPPALGL